MKECLLRQYRLLAVLIRKEGTLGDSIDDQATFGTEATSVPTLIPTELMCSYCSDRLNASSVETLTD